MSDDEIAVKVVLLGESGVGKTAILNRYIGNTFIENQPQTIGANFQQKVESYQGRKITLSIWDTAGQEIYRTLTPMYYRDAHMALIIFSVVDKISFDAVEEWVNQVKTSSPDVIMIICGNKDDIQERAVTFEDGLNMAEKLGVSYVETSALNGHGVDFAFQSLIELYVSKTAAQTKNPIKRVNTVELDNSMNSTQETEKKKCC